jgi:hypothetical protein
VGYLAIIFGPPLILVLTGIVLFLTRPLSGVRALAAGLVLLGVGQIALTSVSFSACTPFDDDGCHGSSWDRWSEAIFGWCICAAALLGSVVVATVKGLGR